MDRLEEVKARLVRRAYTMGHEDDVRWLVAEVERLREALLEIEAHAQLALAPKLEDVIQGMRVLRPDTEGTER